MPSNGKSQQPTIIAGRPATVEQVPSRNFRERLDRVYWLLENYLLTGEISSSIVGEHTLFQ